MKKLYSPGYLCDVQGEKTLITSSDVQGDKTLITSSDVQGEKTLITWTSAGY